MENFTTYMESGISFETPVTGGRQSEHPREYEASELEEIGNELQICIVLVEGSDMVSWITHDSGNFRKWLSSAAGQSALEIYLLQFPLEKIHQRGDLIVAQYEHPENLPSIIADDTALSVFVAAFRKAYPHAVDIASTPTGETLH